eukprot:m.15098 g.15098  ORF g.15098 m.15098 type:complete len:740 (+) comp10622_c0_seq2:247-2466(+)
MDWLRKRSKRGNSTSPKGTTEPMKPDNQPDGNKDSRRPMADSTPKLTNRAMDTPGSSATGGFSGSNTSRSSSSPRSKRKGKSGTPKSTSSSPQSMSPPAKSSAPSSATSLSPPDHMRQRSATKSDSTSREKKRVGKMDVLQPETAVSATAQRAASISSSQPMRYEHLKNKVANEPDDNDNAAARRRSNDKSPSPLKHSKSPSSAERPQTVWEKPGDVSAAGPLSEESFGLDSRRASEDSLSSKLGISFGTGFSSVSPSPDRLPSLSEDPKPAPIEASGNNGATASDLRDLLTGPKWAVASSVQGDGVAALSDVATTTDADDDIEGLTKEIEQLETSYHYATIKSDGTLKRATDVVTGETDPPEGTVCISTGETIARYLTSRTEQTNPFAKELGEHQRQVDMFVTCSDTMLTHLLKFLDSAWADDLAVVHKHFDDERAEIERLLAEKSAADGGSAEAPVGTGDGIVTKGQAPAQEADVPDDVTAMYDTVNGNDTSGTPNADDVAIQALLEREARAAAGLSLDPDPLEGILPAEDDPTTESYEDCTIRPGDFAAAKQQAQQTADSEAHAASPDPMSPSPKASPMGSPPETQPALGSPDSCAIHNGDDGVDVEDDGAAASDEASEEAAAFASVAGHGLKRGTKHKATIWMKPKKSESSHDEDGDSPVPSIDPDAGTDGPCDASASPEADAGSDDVAMATTPTAEALSDGTAHTEDDDIPEELPSKAGSPGKGSGGQWVSLSP